MGIQDFFKSAGEGGCLAMCYIVAALKDKTSPTMIFEALWTAAKQSVIDIEDDCFVTNGVKLMSIANPSKKYSVIKQPIHSLIDLGGQLAAVNYIHKCCNHWVLVENGEIIFDSLENSQCVKYGEPIDARIIEIGDK